MGLVAVHCDQPITNTACQRRLSPHYTQTRLPVMLQTVLSGSLLTEDILTRLDQCSNGEGSMFVCSSTISGCQDNGLPIMPCKHSCQRKYSLCTLSRCSLPHLGLLNQDNRLYSGKETLLVVAANILACKFWRF